MLTFILITILGMAGVFFAEINGHIHLGKTNQPIQQIRFLLGKKILPGWIITVYMLSNIAIWIGVLGTLSKLFS